MSENALEEFVAEIHPDDHHEPKWIVAAAITAAVFAGFAAGAGALATKHLTQCNLVRVAANDRWASYQTVSINSSLVDAKMYTAQLKRVEPRQSDTDTREEYLQEMPRLQKEARHLEKLSRENLESHEWFEGLGTVFHVAIALVAVAMVTKRKELWYVSLILGSVAIILFGREFFRAPAALEEDTEPSRAGLVERSSQELPIAPSATTPQTRSSETQ